MAVAELLKSMAMLLIMICPGFIFKRKKIITQEHLSMLSNLLINLIVPCIIIHSFQMEYSQEMASRIYKIGVLWALMLVVCVLVLFVAIKVLKAKGFERGVLAGIIMIPNTGFVGIPVVDAFFGAEGLLYMSICEVVSDLFVFTAIYSYVNHTAGIKEKKSIKDLLSPPVVATIVGFILFRFNIMLPSFVGDAVEKIGAASTALAMIVLGGQVADLRLKDFFGKGKTYITVALRLVLMPLIAYILMKFVFVDTSFMAKIFVLAWAMPVGIFSVVFAEKLGKDATYATENVMLSNVLCLLTIPIWTMLM